MSGRINYSNLSDSLKEHLNGLGLTEEQVNELIENALVEINEKDVEQDEVVNALVDKVGELNGLMTEEKGDLVGAINELFQSANNGKELIANAIGEPVSADDTFSAMSNDINSLLSTFKTNMMNNGVIVESGDKFKSLIEKIKGLTEGGGNKGIQFISGTLGSSNYVSRNMTQTSGNVNSVGCFKIPMPNFEPVLIYAEGRITSQACDSPTIYLNLGRSGGYSFSYRKASNVYYTTCYFYKMDRDSEFLYLQTEGISSSDTFDYYIIGVGEDDTTLRDSLASILQEEGVSVTEEDDMASLINKVDEEFDRQVVPQGTATINDVVSGKTFINSTGQLLTGTASKGLATATGTVNVSSTIYTSKSFTINIDFTPTRLILIVPKVWYNSGVIEHENVIVTNETTTLNAGPSENGTIKVSSMTSYSFNIQMFGLQIPECTITWIAIG